MPSRDKHAPRRLSHYDKTHVQRMGNLMAEGFVLSDGAGQYVVEVDGTVTIEGTVRCLGSIVVGVSKTMRPLTLNSDPMLETTRYCYNASVSGHNFFLRYDNSTHYRSHPDAHHRHVADWKTENDHGRVEWVGLAGWPTLSEFMEEVRTWYWEHQHELPE